MAWDLEQTNKGWARLVHQLVSLSPSLGLTLLIHKRRA